MCIVNGKRAHGKEPHELEVGEYSKWDSHDSMWYARCPDGSLANLSAHQVTEHEDGTISVVPSILVSFGNPPVRCWHGFLEHGVWREA